MYLKSKTPRNGEFFLWNVGKTPQAVARRPNQFRHSSFSHSTRIGAAMKMDE
jgi:hypothetical protein